MLIKEKYDPYLGRTCFSVTTGSALMRFRPENKQGLFPCRPVQKDKLSLTDLTFLGSRQFHRQTEGLLETDGGSFLRLTRDDGQPFQQENETNC